VLAGARFERCGAGVAGELCVWAEPLDRADLAEQLRCASTRHSRAGQVAAVRLRSCARRSENTALLSALVNAPRAKGRVVLALARRPRFDLAEFWGWGSMPRPTQPSQANQHGWFYPAHRSNPPVIVLMVNGYRFVEMCTGPVFRNVP
jgi:hypothetical protein